MRHHPLIATAVTAGLLATACGDAGSGGGSGSGGGPTIAVATTVLGDVVAHLVGEEATVDVVMPANADPHEFQPSARQAVALREADLVVTNGAGFEAGLDDTVDAAEEDGTPVFVAVDHVDTLVAGEDGDDHADEEAGGAGEDGDDHGDGDVDPHFFTDPLRMADAAEALSEELAAEVPGLDTAAFRERAAAYVAELRALDGEVREIVAPIPDDRRRLVTNHLGFTYFADRYGFEVVGAVIPSASTAAAPSAGELDDLAAAITAEGVPAVFTDASSSARLADTLAGEAGDVAVVELFSESLGDPGTGADSYVGMMRTNATRIADALAP